MTREEIENMPAGREMDVLVAEMAMKWRIGTPGINAGFWVDEHGKEMKVYTWNPSCSFLESESVLEKIKDKIFCIYWKDNPKIDGWTVQLNAMDSYSGSEIVYGETFMLAICRAALLLAVIESE